MRRGRFQLGSLRRAEGELEILPMMNLFVVLIPMLLLSAVFLEMAVIRMNLPSDDDPATDTPKEPLALSVTIEAERFLVTSSKTAPQVIDRATTNADAAETALRTALAGVKERFPKNEELVIRSQETTHYEDIVSVMDVSRETGLPNVGLAGVSP